MRTEDKNSAYCWLNKLKNDCLISFFSTIEDTEGTALPMTATKGGEKVGFLEGIVNSKFFTIIFYPFYTV
jgi:hypothetical protein